MKKNSLKIILIVVERELYLNTMVQREPCSINLLINSAGFILKVVLL